MESVLHFTRIAPPSWMRGALINVQPEDESDYIHTQPIILVFAGPELYNVYKSFSKPACLSGIRLSN